MNKIAKLKKDLIQTQKASQNIINQNVHISDDIVKLSQVINNKGGKNL
jgi:hypothetical protein